MRHSTSREQQARRSGWTRVEAVAVLGVTGALASVVFPVAARASIFDLIFGRSGQSSSSCQGNLRQMGLGLMQYTQDYDERYPLATTKGPEFGWANALQPYIKSTQVFQCPNEKHVQDTDAPTPTDSFKKPNYTDYWLNSNISGKPLAGFINASQVLAMGDGDGGSAASTARYNIRALPASWIETKGSPALRHTLRSTQESGANYGFADGHVKFYTPEKISGHSLAKAGGNPTFSIK